LGHEASSTAEPFVLSPHFEFLGVVSHHGQKFDFRFVQRAAKFIHVHVIAKFRVVINRSVPGTKMKLVHDETINWEVLPGLKCRN
jgi:hypothetical protein